jgi:negative regulator of flagellin synthesis FlgM
MKIGSPAEKPTPPVVTNGTGAVNGNANPTAAAVAAGGAIPETADPSATIEISNTASALLSGSSTAEFDAEKVARISSAIDDGSFQINPEAIADKLISNAQEVLSKVQSS